MLYFHYGRMNQINFISFFLLNSKHRCKDEKSPRAKPYKYSNQKIKDLGLKFTPVRQCLYDSVKSLQDKGHLPIPTQNQSNFNIN